MKFAEDKPVLKADTPIAAPIAMTPQPQDNHIYFWEVVQDATILTLIRSLKETDIRLRTEALQRDIDLQIPIKLYINSGGGNVLAALTAYDVIKNLKTPVHTYVESISASAATLLSIAGTKRFIMPNSYMLIHQFTTFFWGTYEQFKDEQKINDDMIERMRQIYTHNTKLKYEKVTKLLKHDSWFNAEEAVKLGLVDTIA